MTDTLQRRVPSKELIITNNSLVHDTFTAPRNSRTRIYEKLRKRSYRKLMREQMTQRQHEYYLQGVTDALDALRNETL